MNFRHLFSSSPLGPAPAHDGEAVSYPFPEALIERLKLELGGGSVPRTTVGVQVGLQSPRLTSFLLAHGLPLFAVGNLSANPDAVRRLGRLWPSFQLFDGTPAATGLEAASVDYIVSDRALYWPDQAGVRAEFTRVLRPGGLVALVTDNRVYGGGEQAHQFEALLRDCCPDFREKRETFDIGQAVRELFHNGNVFEDAFTGEQRLTLREFLSQTEAMPVYPAAGDPARIKLDRTLRQFFTQWSEKGRLRIPTVCRVAFGHMTR